MLTPLATELRARYAQWRRAACMGLVALALTQPSAAWAQPADQSLEYNVKAAFLLNFAKFTQWPADQVKSGNLQICVLGNNPFGDALQRVLTNRKVLNYTLSSRNAKPGDDLSGCQMVYVPASFSVGTLFDTLRTLPVLTVGESEDFKQAGGIIRLFIVDGRLRFAVNNAVARSTGLQLSSQMLGLATEVVP